MYINTVIVDDIVDQIINSIIEITDFDKRDHNLIFSDLTNSIVESFRKPDVSSLQSMENKEFYSSYSSAIMYISLEIVIDIINGYNFDTSSVDDRKYQFCKLFIIICSMYVNEHSNELPEMLIAKVDEAKSISEFIKISDKVKFKDDFLISIISS